MLASYLPTLRYYRRPMLLGGDASVGRQRVPFHDLVLALRYWRGKRSEWKGRLYARIRKSKHLRCINTAVKIARCQVLHSLSPDGPSGKFRFFLPQLACNPPCSFQIVFVWPPSISIKEPWRNRPSGETTNVTRWAISSGSPNRETAQSFTIACSASIS